MFSLAHQTHTKEMNIQTYNLKLFFLLTLVFCFNPVYSQNSEAQQCTKINNSSKRLACYDSLFRISEDIDNQEVLLIKEKSDNQRLEKIIDDYGLEKPKEIESLTSEIISIKRRGNYKIYIDLKNGQSWRSVKDYYDRIPLKKGQQVIISEGFLSGYVMKVEGKKLSLRVKRLK